MAKLERARRRPGRTCRSVRAMSVSMTGPRSSLSRCTSSMIRRRTAAATATSPPLRVMTSHFSGVVTIICVASSSRLDSCMSPVSSCTTMPVRPRNPFSMTMPVRPHTRFMFLKGGRLAQSVLQRS